MPTIGASKKLRCLAIDDEPLALKLLENFALRVPFLEMVATFEDALSGGEFINQYPVDLLFVDINMPDISGLDLVRSLKVKPLVIFTTAYRNFAFEGFELDALDYLLKPIDFGRFTKAVTKARDFLAFKNVPPAEEPESIFVHSEYRTIRILLNQIEYIESLEDYIRIHLNNAKTVVSLMPLKKVLEKLPENQFKRIHRSYVVPVAKVMSLLNRKVLLESGKELPIGSSYQHFIEEWKGNK